MKRITILLMGISLFALLATSCKSFADSQETTSSVISDSSFNDTPIESMEDSTNEQTESMEESSDELMDSTEDSMEESSDESSGVESDTWQDENVDNSGGWT